MNGKRQKRQQAKLPFGRLPKGEAPKPIHKGSEPIMAVGGSKSPAETERLMEEICERENLKRALRRVQANKGAPGVDGMTVNQLGVYLRQEWSLIHQQLLDGTFAPKPVKRVEIPKPGGHGVRNLGVPCAVDRFVQQAILQVLERYWDPTFSDHSFGFRPGRSAHQAIAQAQRYINEGSCFVVDLDLEKFFDQVCHDKLMSKVASRTSDKRLLRVIRAFLNAGVMNDGLTQATTRGVPQGGPLSPLLSNIVLDELDRELERRGHRFCRYADDANVYVRSQRAAKRVMRSLRHFITHKLRLKVNDTKSAVAQPWERKFLGFTFTRQATPKRAISFQATQRFKNRVRALTRRTRGISLEQMVQQLNRYLRGWCGYFGYCETPSILQALNSWIRRRLRSFIWKQWRRGCTRYRELTKRGVSPRLAAQTAASPHGPWRISQSPALCIALPNAFFDSIGLLKLAVKADA